MNIENEIFKKSSVNIKRLINYGFRKEKDIYIIEKSFLDNSFKAIITISNNGIVEGKVIDLHINEEYTNFRTDMTGEFVNKVREEYKKVLIDIRDNCFENNCFIYNQANRINKYIREKYNSAPEFLWKKFPGYAIYRSNDNNKWYAIIMNLDLSKLDSKTGEVEIINVKLDRNKINNLLKQKGFYKAYHMSKTDWISILLNDTIEDNIIMSLIDESFKLINR